MVLWPRAVSRARGAYLGWSRGLTWIPNKLRATKILPISMLQGLLQSVDQECIQIIMASAKACKVQTELKTSSVDELQLISTEVCLAGSCFKLENIHLNQSDIRLIRQQTQTQQILDIINQSGKKRDTFWSSHEFIKNLWGEEGYVVLWLKQCFQTVLGGC